MFRLSVPLSRSFRIHYIPMRAGGQEARIKKGLKKAGQDGPLWEGPDWSYLDGTPGPLSKGQLQRQSHATLIIKKAHEFIESMETSRKILDENPDIGKPTKEDITKYY
ncbi:hypothetical protein LOD99_13057 [Oopsacas minuta]|uniref:Large ribosomal subunit protein mL52 n=1 Tax=Oopsacas minuta TaxID=111878 RepID=A0AAV7JAR1_9METZ|nr:hypothetical protein LOD99_13057 [Oopsacas minuta]